MKGLLLLSYFTMVLSHKNYLNPTHSPSHSTNHHPTHTPSHSPSHSPTHYPTHSPSHSPTHSPSHSPTHVRGSCIHGSGMVSLLSGEQAPISNVSIGMIIQTANKDNAI
jgi:hypothetical protein